MSLAAWRAGEDNLFHGDSSSRRRVERYRSRLPEDLVPLGSGDLVVLSVWPVLEVGGILEM